MHIYSIIHRVNLTKDTFTAWYDSMILSYLRLKKVN